MNHRAFNAVLGFAVLTLLLAFQNCSNARFTSDVGPLGVGAVGDGGGDDTFCRPDEVTANKIVKVLFVVDNSGSNVRVGQGTGDGDGSDPTKSWRHSVLTNFINTYKTNSNFHFGLITFQGYSATPQIKVNNRAAFTNDMALVDAGVQNFMNTPDGSYTPYQAALALTEDIISNDMAANPTQDASYVMVMVSDGKPTDYHTPDEMAPDAQAIRDLARARISLNTVFYYNSSYQEDDTLFLRKISSLGNGQFLIANSNEVLKVDEAINVPGAGCQ